jgi:arylformamidase
MARQIREGSMPKKGPPVFLGFDQAELDAAYDQAAYAPNREQLIKRRISDSERARHRIGEPERAAYGAAEIEQLDIYRTGRGAAPVFIFIHGGAWRSGRSRDFATPAEMFIAAGAHYVVPDFAWVQDVDGNLIVLADQVCRAVAWVYRNATRFGGDPNRLYLGGQSSGGHLAAVALTTDWQRNFGLPADIIKGGICISGMYDLAPVRLSARSSYVKFDDTTVAALSPMRHLDRLRRWSSLTAPARHPNSSARTANSPPRSKPPARGCSCWSASTTTTSNCRRHSATHTASWGGPRSI